MRAWYGLTFGCVKLNRTRLAFFPALEGIPQYIKKTPADGPRVEETHIVGGRFVLGYCVSDTSHGRTTTTACVAVRFPGCYLNGCRGGGGGGR